MERQDDSRNVGVQLVTNIVGVGGVQLGGSIVYLAPGLGSGYTSVPVHRLARILKPPGQHPGLTLDGFPDQTLVVPWLYPVFLASPLPLASN